MFRWSNGEGRLAVHNPKRAATLRIELLRGASSEFEVLLNGSSAARFMLEAGWQRLEVELPRIIDGDAIEVLLRCAPWRPAEVAGGNDLRRLGLALRRASVI